MLGHGPRGSVRRTPAPPRLAAEADRPAGPGLRQPDRSGRCRKFKCHLESPAPLHGEREFSKQVARRSRGCPVAHTRGHQIPESRQDFRRFQRICGAARGPCCVTSGPGTGPPAAASDRRSGEPIPAGSARSRRLAAVLSAAWAARWALGTGRAVIFVVVALAGIVLAVVLTRSLG